MSALLTDPISGDLVVTKNELTFVDGPQQVRQRIASRIRFFQGEWFLDTTDGTPMIQEVLTSNPANAEAALKARINGTPGVLGINSFSLVVNDEESLGVAVFNVQSQNGPLPAEVEFPVQGG